MFPSISKNRKKANSITDGSPRKGMVFIPDISGFTELVRSTDLVTGRIITSELLSVIIRHNRLDMEIAEIEGDAVFFFKWSSIPSVDALFEQFEIMKSAFDAKIRELEYRYDIEPALHLKAVAHYGEMTGFSIEGFQKLYGEVVVEAHRLLKNAVPARSYLLVTDELMAAAGTKESEALLRKGHSSTLCELYEGVRNLCFTYILFPYLRQAPARV
ncbi:DUF2652 domain-containing protein [Chitinophaga deserti]|uniref:DUF2652 domain-containing protein n=1 Tax=Chitinophaga deserti TaxID=2164099 RepID=UPI000D6C3E5B|nr:DUF2652 domain-containing protein [Chitinophaga deserti]